jgi:hypothetical protein
MIQQIPFDEYLKHPAISRSKLNDLLKSKWHYENDYIKPSPEMALGSYIHEKILTPELDTFEVIPKIDRRTKVGKEQYEAFTTNLAASGKQPIEIEQAERAAEAICNVKTNEICKGIIDMAEWKEATVIAHEDGFDFKARFDLLSVENSFIADIKTTRDASADGFKKSLANFNYHLQAAFYLDIANLALGTNIKDFFIIAVETSEPFGVAVYRLHEDAVESGRALLAKAISRLKNLGKLPRVYPEIIQDIDLPQWAYYRDQE